VTSAALFRRWQVSARQSLSTSTSRQEHAQRGQTLMAFLDEARERVIRINSEENLMLSRSE
jgi:hypothetical protein